MTRKHIRVTRTATASLIRRYDAGVTSFEQIRKERVGPDAALDALARIVPEGDVAGREGNTPESPGSTTRSTTRSAREGREPVAARSLSRAFRDTAIAARACAL